DVTESSQIADESAAFASEFTFYPGDETQEPDPDLEAFLGAGNVPAYRGGAPYIVLPDWDVTDSRGMAPQIRAELATAVNEERGVIAIGRIGDSSYGTIQSFDGIEWSTPITNSPVGANTETDRKSTRLNSSHV